MELFALRCTDHVVLDVTHGQVQVVTPVDVGSVETVTAGVVEPRLLSLLPCSNPLLAVCRTCELSQSSCCIVVLSKDCGEVVLHSEVSEILELVIGTEENRVHTHHHLGDSQVWDAGERFLAETEEVQVCDVSEVQELEVVLPVLVCQLDQTVIVSHHLGGGVNTRTAGDDLNVNHVWESFEVDRVHLFDGCENLLLPVLQQGVPVLEVVTSTLHEVRNAVTDELRCNSNRAHVAEAVVDAELNTVCRRNDVVTSVVRTETTNGEFNTDRLEGLEHVGPVLRVAEPELGVFLVLQVFLEDEVVWVKVLPTFSTLRCWQVIRRDEALTSSAWRHCFCLLSEHVVVPFSSSRLVVQ